MTTPEDFDEVTKTAAVQILMSPRTDDECREWAAEYLGHPDFGEVARAVLAVMDRSR